MAHEYTNTALTILQDLIVLDRYRRASDRPDEDEFVVTAGNICLIEVLLTRFFDGFLQTDQEMMRNGQSPLEIHLETGAGSSHVIPSALLASLFRDRLLGIETRGVEERFALPGFWIFILPILFFIRGEARGALLDLNLRPASNEGDITIRWNVEQQGIVITLQFETTGVEIAGIADIWGHFEGDISQLDVSVVLRPSIRAHRLLWEREVTVTVDAVSRIPTVSDAELEGKVRDAIESVLNDLLKNDVAQLLGSVFAVVPLRPVTDSPAALSSVESNLEADLNYWSQQWYDEDFPDEELPTDLAPPARLQDITPTQLALSFVFGGLDQSLYDAALLPACLRHVVPPSRDFVEAVLRPLRDANLNLADGLPLDWIQQTLELFARRRFELAHLVNRTDSYSDAHLEEDQVSSQSRLVTEHTPLPDVPSQPGVVCMRYRIALDAVTFLVPGADGNARVEYSVGVWHPLLADDSDVVNDDVADLDRIEGRADIILGRADINLAVVSYLEWGGKVRLSGKVAAGALGGEADFLHDIDISSDDMELRGEFPPEDPDNPEGRKFIVHYHIQQLPFAQAYDWIEVDFDRVTLPQVSRSQFQPEQIRVLIEGFVNRNPESDVPCHSGVFDPALAVNPNDWKSDVVYPENDVGNRLSVALRVTFLNRLTGAVIDSYIASREIARFSNETQEEVAADDLIEAAAAGAVVEWSIPAGLPATAFVMRDEREQISVLVTLRNQRFTIGNVPAELIPKSFDIEFPSVRVENDKDHGLSGVGEVRFTCSVEVRTAGQAEETPPHFSWSGRTRILEAQDPVDLELPGPPAARTVEVRPGDELVIEVSGLEFDWPPFDPHDRMGKATMRRTVPEDDSLDHRNAGLFSCRSDTRDFEAQIRIVTTSRPPAPRFFFEDVAADVRDFITQLELEQGTPARLSYDGLVEWATSGRLARSIDGEEWIEEAAINTDDPSHSFDVTANQTTFYRIEVSNIVGTTLSRTLTIQVSE